MICTASKLRVDEINDPGRLEDLRLIWQALWSATARASFFQTLDWLQNYWHYFGADQQLRVLVVSRGTHPVGILPLAVRRERTRIGTVRVLTYPLADWGSWYGPIGPNPAATLAATMRYLHGAQRNWDLLDLRWVDRDTLDRGRTPNAMQLAGLVPHERIWKTIAVVDLQSGWKSYWSSRTRKFRQNTERQERRLRKCGTVDYIRYRPTGRFGGDDDPNPELYNACVRLARASWQHTDQASFTFAQRHIAGFFRAAHHLAVRNGLVDVNLLTVDGTPVAYAYNYHHDGRLFGLRMGYDPAYKQYGVGNTLLYRMLADSAHRHDTMLDLGFGDLGYKAKWSTRFVQVYQYTHYPSWKPRSQLLRFKHWTDMQRRRFRSEVGASV